jgi:hypothetical protein
MSKVIEVWADTGETVERDMTKEEIAQRKKDQASEAAYLAELEEKSARRAEILERLGLTEDEAKLILG